MSYTVSPLILAAALGLVGPAALVPTMPRPRRYATLAPLGSYGTDRACSPGIAARRTRRYTLSTGRRWRWTGTRPT